MLNRLMQRGLTAALIEEIQAQRLRDTVKYVHERSPFYRRLFKEAGLMPEDIVEVSDLRKVPFTTSQDIRQWRDFLCVSEDKVSAVFTTSGTTGEPKRVYYTFREMQTLSNLFAVAVRTVHTGNLVALIALPLSHGLWIGSASVQRAVERAGGLSLPVGADDPRETIVWMKRFNPNAIFSSPSYMTALTREAERCGFRPEINTILLAGELLTEEHKQRFSEYWNAEIYDSFGSTEIGSAQTIALPGCKALHLNDLHLITEIISPETGLPAEEGELVFTTIRREGMPLLRYRSGDQARWTQCGCWLPLNAIQFMGRADDMIVAGDMNLFGRVMAEAIAGISGATGRISLEVDKVNLTDKLKIQAEGRGISEETVRQALFAVYPELSVNIGNGNILLAVDVIESLGNQIKDLKIIDRRTAANGGKYERGASVVPRPF